MAAGGGDCHLVKLPPDSASYSSLLLLTAFSPLLSQLTAFFGGHKMCFRLLLSTVLPCF